MERILFLIDGFNLYHAIAGNDRLRGYKWLNIHSLSRLFLKSSQSIAGILYFTALAHWNREKVLRHQTYIKALRSEGVEIVYGEFKRVQRKCRRCGETYWTHEEKQTDVNIAIHLFQRAINDAFDIAILVSGDTDLVPPFRRAQLLEDTADFHMKLKEKHLKAAQFELDIKLKSGSTISCPPAWRP